MRLVDRGPADAIDVLCAHHDQIRALLQAAQEQPRYERRRTLDLLSGRLASHEAAEGVLLRPVTRMCVLGGEVVAEARLAEERRTAETLDDLLAIDLESGQFTAEFGAFSRALTEHMDSEELYEFPLVRAYRDDAALQALGAVLHRADPMAGEASPSISLGLAGALVSSLTAAVGMVRKGQRS